jgi:hypothetical protein
MPATQPNSPSCCTSSAAGWPATPAASAHRWKTFAGNPAYGTAQLREDLDRFTFLLGGNDGEPLFSPEPQ